MSLVPATIGDLKSLARHLSSSDRRPQYVSETKAATSKWLLLVELLEREKSALSPENAADIVHNVCFFVWLEGVKSPPLEIQSGVESLLALCSSGLCSDDDEKFCHGLMSVLRRRADILFRANENEEEASGLQGVIRPLISILKQPELRQKLLSSSFGKEYGELRTKLLTYAADRILGEQLLCTAAQTASSQQILTACVDSFTGDDDGGACGLALLWPRIKSTGSIQGRVTILTAVASAFFAGKATHDPYYDSDLFLTTVREGLVHPDSFVRKRSLYLLKRAVDHQRTVARESKNPLLFEVSRHHKVWNDFFLVVECSGEKQVHIVKQITPRLADLTKNCGGQPMSTERPLHFSWVLVLFRILFKHQNQAIARWSVGYFLETFRLDASVSRVSPLSSELSNMITNDLLVALNDPKLFSTAADCRMDSAVLDFLKSWGDQLENEANQATFWNSFLAAVLDAQLDVVPLFFVLVATLQAVPESSSLLTRTTLQRVAEFVAREMRNQYPMLKGGVQAILIKLVMSTTDASVLAMPETEASSILAFLSAFHQQKCVLVRDTDLWSDVKNWVAKARSDGFDLCRVASADCDDDLAESNALLLLLSPTLEEDLKGIEEEVASSANRPYNLSAGRLIIEKELVDRWLSGPERRGGRDEFVTYAADLASHYPQEVPHDYVSGAIARLRNSENVKDTESNYFILDQIFRCQTFHESIASIGLRSLSDVMQKTKGNARNPTRPYDLLAMNILKRCVHHSAYRDTVTQDGTLHSLFTSGLLPSLTWVTAPLPNSSDRNTFEGDCERKSWAIHQCLNVEEQWEILREILIGIDQPTLTKMCPQLLEAASACVSSGGAAGLNAVMKCMQAFVTRYSFENSKTVLEALGAFVRTCKSLVFDFRKNEHFFPLLNAFVKMALCDNLMNQVGYLDAAIDVIESLISHGQLVPGAAALVAARLGDFVALAGGQLWTPALMSSLVDILTFGTLHKKDHKIIEDANKVIMEYDLDTGAQVKLPVNVVEGSDHLVESMVKAHGLRILLTLCLRKAVSLSDLTQSLFDRDESLPKRLYENSQAHLVKHRIYQALLILTEFCDADCAGVLQNRVVKIFNESSLQPSVRYLCEWIAVRLNATYPELEQIIARGYEKAKKDRLNSVPSYLFIFSHTALHRRPAPTEEDLRKALSVVAPWCMAQHFNTRTAAQTCLKKLHEMAAGKKFEVAGRFQELLNCVEDCVQQGDSVKNKAKLNENPLQLYLDPVAHFNVRDIFNNFPRIVGLLPSEWEDYDAYERVLAAAENGGVDLCDALGTFVPPGLSSVAASRDATKNMSVKRSMEEASLDAADDESVIQKKTMPWMEMLVDDGPSGDPGAETRKKALPDLILVASLIDRLPNLGGMSRTCEILGVGKYVIGCKRYLEEKEFQNTSVTSEKWVPTEEVIPADVPRYLEAKRREGFTIVAVEQTSESVVLGSFSFPRKCVLLLGNERSGIPVELIRLVDTCVEIPQRGLVRSFNVHVTGAIVMWEYAKQHSLPA